MASKNKIVKPGIKKNPATINKDSTIQHRILSENRRARHEYEIIDVIECGIELSGTEVKSLRVGQCSLQDAFACIEYGQAWLYNCNIATYNFGNYFNHEPKRKRRLLLHKKEILKLSQQVKAKGLTLIPLRIFFKRNWIKVDLALARGKHSYDKRESLMKKESQRKLDRLTKQFRTR